MNDGSSASLIFGVKCYPGGPADASNHADESIRTDEDVYAIENTADSG